MSVNTLPRVALWTLFLALAHVSAFGAATAIGPDSSELVHYLNVEETGIRDDQVLLDGIEPVNSVFYSYGSLPVVDFTTYDVVLVQRAEGTVVARVDPVGDGVHFNLGLIGIVNASDFLYAPPQPVVEKSVAVILSTAMLKGIEKLKPAYQDFYVENQRIERLNILQPLVKKCVEGLIEDGLALGEERRVRIYYVTADPIPGADIVATIRPDFLASRVTLDEAPASLPNVQRALSPGDLAVAIELAHGSSSLTRKGIAAFRLENSYGDLIRTVFAADVEKARAGKPPVTAFWFTCWQGESPMWETWVDALGIEPGQGTAPIGLGKLDAMGRFASQYVWRQPLAPRIYDLSKDTMLAR